MNVNVSITVGPTPPPTRVLRVPSTGTFVQVKHDWETEHWSNKPRGVTVYGLKFNSTTGMYEGMPSDNPFATLPDTVPMPGLKSQGDFMPMNEEVQNFWFDLMSLAAENTWGFPELSMAWLNTTQDGKAMTDDHSWSHNESNNTDLTKMFREYITGRNLTTNMKDMAIKSLHMGGNIAKVIGTDTAGNWLIETLDFSHLPDAEEAWSKPWLTPWLTQTAVNPTRAVDWPQLGEYGVPFPLVGIDGVNKLPKSWAKPISNGVEYNPYP